MLYTKGIAHISFKGGGMFLAARSSHDREILIQHVMFLAGLGEKVQILVNEQRWLVSPVGEAATCACCGLRAEPPCRAAATWGATRCLPCALGTDHADLGMGNASQEEAASGIPLPP